MVGRPSPVVVHAGLDADSVATATIPGATRTTVVTFPHPTCEIEAQLHGQPFEIDPNDRQAQSFLRYNALTWEWTVTALSIEAKWLAVDFYPVIRGATGDKLPGAVRSATVTIAVRAPTPKPWWEQTWKLVSGAVVALVIAWTLRLFGPGKDNRGIIAIWRRLRGPSARAGDACGHAPPGCPPIAARGNARLPSVLGRSNCPNLDVEPLMGIVALRLPPARVTLPA